MYPFISAPANLVQTTRRWRKCLVLIVIAILFSSQGLCSEDEERLVRDLFRGYNKLVRHCPV